MLHYTLKNYLAKHLKSIKMDKLHDYLLHYNMYTKLWYAIPRDLFPEYWCNRPVDGVLSAKKIKTLIELVLNTES